MTSEESVGRGPLVGLRVLELAGIGPGPHAAMILADLGADVIRVERPGPADTAELGIRDDLLLRHRRAVLADLKDADELAVALSLADRADVLIEGMRPGVAERLGIGPAACHARNPALVYARITGWGQDGPLASRAGHDINYIAVTGVLAAIGRAGDRPVPPLNLVGDFGGGSMLAVVGILAALWEQRRSGLGQVVDAAMVDGVAQLAQMVWSMRAAGTWRLERGSNLLDGGAPFYDTYTCADGRHVAVGALEPAFYRVLLSGLGLDPAQLPDRDDRANWPRLRAVLGRAFLTRTRDEWATRFADADACVTPVLDLDEAALHPQVGGRGSVTLSDGARQAAPAPRFSRTPGALRPESRLRRESLADVALDWSAG
jgi:alpha-methylacyl-CoA racemase